jgi:alpha-D-ribose 1-methylphosphonate 5-triphosphate diphosphatase
MSDIILTNARLVLDTEIVRGSLRISQGRIAAVDPGPSAVPGAIDCEGDLLLPGLVELHTDNIERHIEPRPEVHWPHRPAILAHDGEFASVGVTTVFDALRVGSLVSGKASYRPYARALANEIAQLRAEGALRISHFVHLRAEVSSQTLAEELEDFAPEDRVGLISLMDHTPGQRQFRDLSYLRTYLQKKRSFTDAEFEAHVTHLTDLRAEYGERHERAAISAASHLGAVLASHDDTTVEHVEQSAARGIRLAEFPTTIEAARACHEHGIKVIMGAPNLIRGGSHSGNVAAGELARQGLLDILSSDYVPSSLLTAAFQLADFWGDLPRAVATVTRTPAEAAGLDDRGRIAPGLRADLVRVHRLGGLPVVRTVWSQGRRVN